MLYATSFKRLLVTLILVLSVPVLAYSQPKSWTGKVVGVSDGGTITIMHQGGGQKIRLYGVDCPEKRQAFGKKAKQFTSNTVFGKDVAVKPVTSLTYSG